MTGEVGVLHQLRRIERSSLRLLRAEVKTRPDLTMTIKIVGIGGRGRCRFPLNRIALSGEIAAHVNTSRSRACQANLNVACDGGVTSVKDTVRGIYACYGVEWGRAFAVLATGSLVSQPRT